ncbi:hypothetical protein M422DRAFT_267790 [Sphaerobolus stellatus SS14]|uniref:Uncharacterized protein n=1 Tax=Sphaerobolus stellatus (strain SS14) TaxID=990650 RepID=A0A0C9UZQ1_SPHS4|nr:hypothetical protein M422DRAFT_267790 [Sphaerobolus stellatus SS14]
MPHMEESPRRVSPSIRRDANLVLQLIPSYTDVVRHFVIPSAFRRHGACSSFPATATDLSPPVPRVIHTS